MEHMVTIAIPEMNEDVVLAIFDALLAGAPDAGTVMGQKLPDGPTDYMLGLDAVDAHAASEGVVDIFRRAVDGCPAARGADVTIIDLHAERVPDWELEESSELQTA
jgi:hypothetical protein